MEAGMRPVVESAPEEEEEEYAAAVSAEEKEAYAKAAEERLLAWLTEKGYLGDAKYDRLALQASRFREEWNEFYARSSFEDTTNIPNRRYTHVKVKLGERAGIQTTLQVFSLKITKLRVPLQWPLQVFGLVAIRDLADRKRNIIFDRPRDNCQIVTREDPYLKLTGPRRPVVVFDPATFEIDLKVKGTTESEDERLSFLAVTYNHVSQSQSHLIEMDYDSRLSELRFQLGSIIDSVEATIEVRITSGSWPHGLRAQFTASTASLPGAEIVLLDSADNQVKVETGGVIELPRCVLSVEAYGKLMIHVKAFLGDKIVVNSVKHFESKRAGVSNGSLSVDFRKILKANTAGKGEIPKAKTAGKGDGPLGVDFLGRCTLGFNISWSVISWGF